MAKRQLDIDTETDLIGTKPSVAKKLASKVSLLIEGDDCIVLRDTTMNGFGFIKQPHVTIIGNFEYDVMNVGCLIIDREMFMVRDCRLFKDRIYAKLSPYDGFVTEGYFNFRLERIPNTYGTIATTEGGFFRGYFNQDGLPDHGFMISDNGNIIKSGTFARNSKNLVVLHGQGVVKHLSSGTSFTGLFDHGIFLSGSCVTPDGTTATGQFKNWKLHGHSQISSPNGTIVKGNFKEGKAVVTIAFTSRGMIVV